ncbi:MAG: YihY/virulence factor BrkB family protein [Betaproteobacteria bacterium]
MRFKEIWRLAKQAVAAWTADYAPSMGAALSYYTLFSIAPLILIAVAVAGLIFGEKAARGEIFAQLATLTGPEGAAAVESLLENASRSTGGGILATLTGFVLLALGAMSVFGELQNALDRIWRAPVKARESGWWKLIRARVLSFGMVLGIGFLLTVSMILSALIAALGKLWMFPGWETVAHLVDMVLSFGLTTVLFGMIYKLIPRTRIGWRDVWVGAAVTAALFALGKVLIGLYLGRSSVASAFGAAGSLVVLMVWVYYSAQIFLLGAEFTRAYAHAHGTRALSPPAPTASGPRLPRVPVSRAANDPQPLAAKSAMKLGAALALGVAAAASLRFLRRR